MKIVVLLLALGAAAAYKTYDGYQLLDMVPTTEAQVNFLKSLTRNGQAIDFWEQPSQVGQNVRILLSPDQMKRYTVQFAYNRIQYQVVEKDFGLVIRKERDELFARREARGQVFDINDFNTYDDIVGWLNGAGLSKCTAAGLTCSVSNIGQSFEGRNVPVFSVGGGSATNPIIYMDALTHAREWLTGATTLYLMDNLFNNYGVDADVTRLLNNYNWHFVHVMNPDGYDFSWTNDRMHRKNRNTAYCALGNTGVDLNRNYDYKFGSCGVSNIACDDTFCGPSGNSEVETQNVANYINANAANIWTVITVHSYGNYMLFPWGTRVNWDSGCTGLCDLALDHDDLNAVSNAGCAAIEATYNTRWACGNSCATIYETAGATDDYSKGVSGVKYAFNPELRGSSFSVNPSQIPLSFQEFWNGVVAMVDAIAANPPF